MMKCSSLSPKSNKFLYVAIVFFLLICFGVYWITRQNPIDKLQEENPSVKVYYETHTPTPLSLAETEIRMTSPTPLSKAAEGIQEDTLESPSQVGRYLFCTVRDVLGEPIEHGTIQFATQIVSFREGYLRLERKRLPSESYILSASAEGYQSATQTIDPRETLQAEFILDYYCNFSIQVYNARQKGSNQASNHVRQPGTEVILYRSKPSQRPLRHTQRALIELVNGDPVPFEFHFKNKEISISNLSAPRRYSSMTISIDGEPNRFIYPRIGDNLLAIGPRDASLEICKEDPCKSHVERHSRRFNYILPLSLSNSRNARIMDTLHFSLKQKTVSNEHAEIRFSRDDCKYCSKCLYLPVLNDDAQVAEKSVTDERGECRFENLPPGLYYAQARFEDWRSMIRPLFPTSGGAKLTLDNSCTLHIYTKREGVLADSYYLHGECVPNTSISLRAKGTASSGLFSVKTNEYGRASIESIPYGTYTVTAAPEEKFDLSPVQKEVVINNPDQRLHIGFSDWSRHSIEGTVVEYDSLAPIAYIYLELYEARWSGLDPIASTKTDANGAFAFQNLPEGQYKIYYHPSLKENHQYYLYEEDSTSPSDYAPFYQAQEKSKLIYVKDDPVYNIQIKMIGTVATHFSGRVIDESNTPVVGADVQLLRHAEFDSLKHVTLPHGKVKSDENGEFDITIWTRKLPEFAKKSYTGRLFVATTISNPVVVDNTLDRFVLITTPSVIPDKSGFVDFSFVFGNHVENQDIVINDKSYFTVEGRLLSEDGRIPDGAYVSLVPYTGDMGMLLDEIFGNYDPSTGNFSIRGASNKTFGIWVRSAYKKNGNQHITEYLDQQIGFNKEQVQELYLNAKSNREKIKIEITLKECGYLSGRVFDADRNPLPNVPVQTDANIHQSKLVFSDEEGKFHLQGLDKEKIYSLYVSHNDSGPIVLMSDIQPPLNNIILVFKDVPLE
jgi:hypothetical protein